MKNIFFMIILFFSVNTLVASEKEKEYFISTNVISPFSQMNKGNTIINVLTPLFSNLEYGLTISGGWFEKYYFVESKITIGSSTSYNLIPQLQFGYSFFILDYFYKNNSGFYVGGNIRYWDYINLYTETERHNIAPSVHLGYIWKYKKILFDLRMHQYFAIFTTTDIEHSEAEFDILFSPMPKLSPVLPFFSFNLGYKF